MWYIVLHVIFTSLLKIYRFLLSNLNISKHCSHVFFPDDALKNEKEIKNRSHDVITNLGLIPHPEGGYFREIHRSGSTPMLSKGQTDLTVATQFNSNTHDNAWPQQVYEPLTIAPGRDKRRPDGDIRRNCLTTIIWMPTRHTPRLLLAVNLSDHVHFYHGGAGFEYFMYDPVKGELLREVLGPNLGEGQKLQVACPGGVWKCGRLLKNDTLDYCLIGEAVAPGFDFHDFSWVTKSEIMSLPNKEHQHILLQFLHGDIEYLSGKEVEDSARYYDKNL